MSEKITIYTLAKELNMTPSSISRAFNPDAHITDEKRKIILETAQKYNFVPNKMASRLSMKEITIGVLLFHRFEPFYNELIKGINSAHEKLKDYKIKCDLRFLNKNEHNEDDCREILTKFAKYDGIIISGLNHETNGDLLSDIYKKNKNLVLLHTYLLGEEQLFASTSDIETIAKISAEYLKDCLMFSKRKNVALFCSDMSQNIHQAIRDIFIQEAQKHNLNILKIYDTLDSSDTIKAICNDDFDKISPLVDGICITTGNSVELCKYIEQNNLKDKIALVTVDTYPEIKEYINKGVINATISENIASQAEMAYINLFYHISENRQIPKILKSKCELVLKENLFLY